MVFGVYKTISLNVTIKTYSKTSEIQNMIDQNTN